MVGGQVLLICSLDPLGVAHNLTERSLPAVRSHPRSVAVSSTGLSGGPLRATAGSIVSTSHLS